MDPGDGEKDTSEDGKYSEEDVKEEDTSGETADGNEQLEGQEADNILSDEGKETVEVTSIVESAAPTDAVKDDTNPTTHHPLSLSWCFGFNRSLPIHNVSNDSRKMVFYASSHTGVLYDCESNQQCLLQGHGNPITCTAVSGDRRWLVTADKGDDPLLTVWDSFSGVPVCTLFDGLGSGCVAVALSHDAYYLATLTSQSPQVMSMWKWTTDSSKPMCSVQLNDHTHQCHLTFHPTDHSQLISTGESQVAFFVWDGKKLNFSSNQMIDTDFNKPVGTFTQSVFIPDSEQLALTVTSLGYGMVWGPLKKGSKEKKSVKLMRLHNDPITIITTTDSLVVTGDNVGRVKFFSSELKLLHWYDERVGSGPLVSISFAHQSLPHHSSPGVKHEDSLLEQTEESDGVVDGHYPIQSTLEAPPLIVQDFTLSSLSSSLIHVTSNGTITDVLFRGHKASVHGLASHPNLPRIAIAGYSTLLQLWDYQSKEVLVSREFDEPNYVQCISFDPCGEFLGVGFTSGVVLVIDSLALQDSSPVFRYSRHTVSHIAFSHDSHYMATADRDHCITVYTKQLLMGGERGEQVEGVSWGFMAKYRSHYEEIESILFGVNLDSNAPRLLSLGQDRMLVEYDLDHSSPDNLCIQSSDRIEQSAIPTTLTWYPPVSKESFLLLCNDQYKMKLVNSTTKMCRRTLLGPTFGSPLKRLEVLSSPVLYSEPGQQSRRYAAFHTFDRVGLLFLPHDGNPHNSQSLVAHPTGVTSMVTSYDGRYVFTAGGQDCTVNMWTANTQALEAASHLGGKDLEPFYALIEGGRYGEFYAEMEQFFYYAQIKSQGVKTRGMRQVDTTVPVEQVPDLMRALGFYPSEQDIDDMLNEVKFSEYVETGTYVTAIDLPTFIRLYINHRPAFGLSPIDLIRAFKSLASSYNTDDGVSDGAGFTVDRGTLLAMLQENGEHMSEGELVEGLMTLLGHCQDPECDGSFTQDTHTALEQGLPQSISAAQFAESILQLTLESTQQS